MPGCHPRRRLWARSRGSSTAPGCRTSSSASSRCRSCPWTRRRGPRPKRIARAAEASTARVTTSACGKQVTGTGAIIANGYVVTNAHVVAGATIIRVAIGSDIADATPVLFDPNLDVALLYAPGLNGRPLRFAATDPGRGVMGAALGYAGGGPACRPPGRGLGLLCRHRPGHLRQGPDHPPDPGAAGSRRAGRFRGTARPGGRHDRRVRVRGIEDGPGRGLCPDAHKRGGSCRARDRPDGRDQRRRLSPVSGRA